jgi:hypothetical protein
MAWLDDVLTVLTQAGVGTPGVDLFASSGMSVPTGDVPVLTVVETGGSGPQRTQNRLSPPAYRRPMAQIVCRASSYQAARAMAEAAYLALVGVRNQHVNGCWYLEIDAMQEPFDLGVNVNGCAQIAFNCRALSRAA